MTRRRGLTALAVAAVGLIVAATTVLITHHGSLLGLGRQPGALAPTAAPVVNEPALPPAAVAGTQARRATAHSATRIVHSPVAGKSPSSAAAGSGAIVYPGAVTCPDSNVPSSNLYAFECTHADGSPVRWATRSIRVWSEGLTLAQANALGTAAEQWSALTGIALVRASSASGAQVVLTEVPTLDALPDLGADVVEYAVTDVHQTGGYYDHATVHVANVALLDADTWLDTMLHELGHVAGLAHVTGPDEIMRPVVGAPQTSYGDGDGAGLRSERPS